MTEVSLLNLNRITFKGSNVHASAPRVMGAFCGFPVRALHHNHPFSLAAGKLCFESSQQSLLRGAYLIII